MLGAERSGSFPKVEHFASYQSTCAGACAVAKSSATIYAATFLVLQALTPGDVPYMPVCGFSSHCGKFFSSFATSLNHVVSLSYLFIQYQTQAALILVRTWPVPQMISSSNS